MFRSVRTRLTLWYMGLLALVLIIFSVGVYVSLARYMYSELDNELKNSLEGTRVTLLKEFVQGEPEAKAAANALDDHIGPSQAGAIFDTRGSLIAEDTALGDIHAPLPQINFLPEGQSTLFTMSDAESTIGRRVGVKSASGSSAAKTYLIVISQPLDGVANRLTTVRLILLLAICGALVLAGIAGSFLAARSLAPVARMTEQARKMSAENLDHRLPVTNPHDELGRLAATFNELLSRLDRALSQQRRFMADASHELRTPLSVMRTATGVTLEQPHRKENDYREALSMVDQQARRLTRIVTDMFTLARADSGQRALIRTEFYLDELILECVRSAEMLAAGKHVTVRVAQLAETPYRGDEGLLRQLIINLLDNAVKHTPDNGEIRVSLESQDGQLRIVVSDTGAGIPRAAQPHIFERFYRVDKSRARAEASEVGAGAGLGLSIAKWIAETHSGDVTLRRSGPDGSEFVASLPISKPIGNVSRRG